jgi:hypothetical protein
LQKNSKNGNDPFFIQKVDQFHQGATVLTKVGYGTVVARKKGSKVLQVKVGDQTLELPENEVNTNIQL